MNKSVVDDLLLKLIRQEQVQKLQDLSRDKNIKGTGVHKLFSEIRYESLFICEPYTEAEQNIILDKITLLKSRIIQSSYALDEDNDQLISLIQDKVKNGYRLSKELMIYLNRLYIHFKKL